MDTKAIEALAGVASSALSDLSLLGLAAIGLSIAYFLIKSMED